MDLQAQTTASNAPVSRDDVERELDWLISIEPEPEELDTMDDYERLMLPHQRRIEPAGTLLRQYGQQIRPATVEALRDEFYSITESDKYAFDPKAESVARSALSSAWAGLNGWQE
ncbi:hypothetical protein [Caballeronia sp. LZ019]|uniref:hypothetical protein n=1 Tax=Caballeronia sp. LZ019 TaxID=3038555 RepID=UPI0028618077|nr:hypothetical protein [Caballeronia sp. LZ019]MDR5809294.1 hypothetical protein [Caballeronia sp. LZ019]